MKRSKLLVHYGLSSLLCFMAGLILFSMPAQAGTDGVPLTKKITAVPERPGIFDQNIQPLTLQQCSQCHIGVFTLLKEQGTRHQLDCVFCHEAYHTFAPGKVEYQDSIPKCTTCHGLPHGTTAEVSTCSNCHSNAHSPLNIPAVTADQCIMCHSGPPQELQDFPSLHSDVACTDCHTTHGLIPSCYDCHSETGGEPYHLTDVESATCVTCHPVHNPLKLQYADDTPQNQCAPCHKNESHERVLKVVQTANSKHNTEVTCASCHTEHAQIPSCFDCHDTEGHRAGLADADCLRCHTDPHDPLNLTFSKAEPQKSCAGCHGEVYDTLLKSDTRHTQLTCTLCHPSHGEIPECQKCHGVPHGEVMLKQFPGGCGSCHGIAHEVEGRMKD